MSSAQLIYFQWGVRGGEASPKIFFNFCLKLNFLSNALGLRVRNSIVVEL